MSEMDILFSLPKGGRNVDDMGNPPDPIAAPECDCPIGDGVALHHFPSCATRQPPPDPIAAQPEWKCGNEFEPYHPQASHVSPDYRDGWNACYKIAIDALRRERERADEARDGWYMANGVADLAMKHRDAAEADRDALRAELAEDAGGWARAERAEAERDALQADAERYRWLRAAQSQTARNWIVINNRNMYGEHELDAAIDAARKV